MRIILCLVLEQMNLKGAVEGKSHRKRMGRDLARLASKWRERNGRRENVFKRQFPKISAVFKVRRKKRGGKEYIVQNPLERQGQRSHKQNCSYDDHLHPQCPFFCLQKAFIMKEFFKKNLYKLRKLQNRNGCHFGCCFPSVT